MAAFLLNLCILSAYAAISGMAITAGFDLASMQQSFGAEIPVLSFEPEIEEDIVYEGKTPAKVVVEKVVAYPETGKSDEIVLRNEGGQMADLTGWSIQDSRGTAPLVFGIPGCEGNATIAPQEYLVITPQDDFNPCGFPFGISFNDVVMLFDEKNDMIANVSWDASDKGSAVRLIDGKYVQISEIGTVVDVLQAVEDFSIFYKAVVATGVDRVLGSKVNPEYTGVVQPSPPSPDFTIEFPWWFGFSVDRTSIPPPPPPPPPPPSPPLGEVPSLGPYTVFAPTNAAFDQFLTLLGGGRVKIPLQAFLKLPELEDILLYHIYYGDYKTEFMYNNTGIISTLGSELVVMKDPRWTEGQIALNDACVDKPTSGYPCAQQLEFNKCYEPFMVSPLAAGWQGGFCQKTCKRCTCNDVDGGICARILYPDVVTANGVVHGISRVMLPPPIFSNVAEDETVPEPEDEGLLMAPVNGVLPTIPTLPSLPSLPGRV